MFSSVGAPALVPILMPGGMGRMVAELEEADASKAAPPIAALAKSGLAGFNSGLFIILKLRADRCLYVGLCAAKVGKISYNPDEPGPRAGVVQIVSGIGGRN